ncbi:MAG: aldo/keto reductase, partial [Candidatus Aenigmarchaeota archaeon]|nr:aldo/keto reductase [Candidatus Aenigmarchaeota archaeon]
MKIPEVKLSDGHRMPILGLGTWQLAGDTCLNAVKEALKLGYAHIDTADIYGNHREVGEAIKGHDRSELFITTKAWRSDFAYDNLLKACDRSLKEIGTEYLDLYLLHWPNDSFPISETMKALNKLVEDGKVRSIGISNFDEDRIEEAIKHSKVPIVTNQVEFHAHLYQKELLEYSKNMSIVITAYSPVARGHIMSDRLLKEIGDRQGKTVGQVSLRWLVQHGIVVIPKSTRPHLRENMDIFDWKLTEKEM